MNNNSGSRVKKIIGWWKKIPDDDFMFILLKYSDNPKFDELKDDPKMKEKLKYVPINYINEFIGTNILVELIDYDKKNGFKQANYIENNETLLTLWLLNKNINSRTTRYIEQLKFNFKTISNIHRGKNIFEMIIDKLKRSDVSILSGLNNMVYALSFNILDIDMSKIGQNTSFSKINVGTESTILTEMIKKENEKLMKSYIDCLAILKIYPHIQLLIKKLKAMGYSINVRPDDVINSKSIRNIVNDYQEETPTLLRNDYPTYSTGRPKITMKKLMNTSKLGKMPNLEIYNSVEEGTICLNKPVGPVENKILIPIIRFGASANTGYYGTKEEKGASFTWYYLEPESEFLLLSNKTLIARNKHQAILLLLEKVKDSEAEQFIENYINHFNTNWLEKCKINDKPVNYDTVKEILLKTDKEEEICNKITNYFRNTENGYLLHEGGGADGCDPHITKLGKLAGYDVVILTHQAGNSGRFVSELVDTRPRTESFNNIYKLSD